MGKVNYYSIHKNKKPKSLRQKRFKYRTSVFAKIALLKAMSYMQIETIKSQPLGNIDEKKKAIANVILSYSSNVVEELKQEKQNRFNNTKRYIK